MPEENNVESSKVERNRNPHGYGWFLIKQPKVLFEFKKYIFSGDPDDKRMYKKEHHFVRNKVREAARILCADVMREFAICAANAGLKIGFKCQNENRAQYECMKKWIEDEKLYKVMMEEYLEERTRFRLTGVSKPLSLRKGH